MITSLMAGLLLSLATAQEELPPVTQEASQVDKKFLAEERKRLAGERQCWKKEGEAQQVCFDGLFAEDVYKDTKTAEKWRAQREKFRGMKFEHLNKAQIEAVGQFKCHLLEEKKQPGCYDELYTSPSFANKPTPKSRRWVIARKLTHKLCGPGMALGEQGCTTKELAAQEGKYKGIQADLYRVGCDVAQIESEGTGGSSGVMDKEREGVLKEACQKQLLSKERPYKDYVVLSEGLSTCPRTLGKLEDAVASDSDKVGFPVHWVVLRDEDKFKQACQDELAVGPKRERLRKLIESGKCSTLPVILDIAAVDNMNRATVDSYLGGCDAERGAEEGSRKPKEQVEEYDGPSIGPIEYSTQGQ